MTSALRRSGLRRALAVLLGKTAALASRALRRGGGTTVPGVIALHVEPDISAQLSSELPGGSIIVSGTNGKTTTSRMAAVILQDAGFRPIRNDSGSNLLRGVTSALVEAAPLFGSISGGPRTIGLFEVDEASVPRILHELTPRAILLLDLFRDQLDRYGEVATVARLWSEALDRLPASTTVIVNALDPLVVHASAGTSGRLVYFGISSADRSARVPEHASDVKACPRCGGLIHYSDVFLGHLGRYRCSRCDFRTPEPTVVAHDVQLRGVEGSGFRLQVAGEEESVVLPLPGMYNVINAVGAAALASTQGLGAEQIATSIGRVTPAFGRMERLSIAGREVVLALAKNPTGLNEVLRTVKESRPPLHLLVMLNDLTADGRDVSWIWDADVEMLAGRIASVVFSGIRAFDFALRFKYGEVIGGSHQPPYEIIPDPERAFRAALTLTPPSERLFIVPTYTALLDIRNTLTRLGYVKAYWER